MARGKTIDPNATSGSTDESSRRALSRHKRLAIFPEGATWSLAMCSTFRVLNVEYQGVYVEAVNWGFSWDLPTNISDYGNLFKSEFATARRTRRALYEKLETVMETLGFNGKSCILRSLCEATSVKFLGDETTVIEKIIRLIFKFPLQILHDWEARENVEYKHAVLNGSAGSINCQEVFPDCPFSLLDIAMHREIKF